MNKKTNRMRMLILLAILTIVARPGFTQQLSFVTEGEVIYEMKVNMYARIAKQTAGDGSGNKQYAEQYRKNMPQFYVEKKTLAFTTNGSLYTTAEPDKRPDAMELREPWVVINNTVYQNFVKDTLAVLKSILNERYMFKDKNRPVRWKITGEERDIAGYRCKRANGLTEDSIYVVAFYTENIMITGGPESYSGLPGMILGVALPHEHVSWFAIKVNISSQVKRPEPPNLRRKKILTRKELEQQLHADTRNWGLQQANALKAFLN